MFKIALRMTTIGMVFVLLVALRVPVVVDPLLKVPLAAVFPWFVALGGFVIFMAARGYYRRHGIIAGVAYATMMATLFLRIMEFGPSALVQEPNSILFRIAMAGMAIVWLTSFPRSHMGSKELITWGAFRLWAHPFYGMALLMEATGTFRPETFTVAYATSWLLLLVSFLVVCYYEEVETIARFEEEAALYYARTPSVHYLLWRLSGTYLPPPPRSPKSYSCG